MIFEIQIEKGASAFSQRATLDGVSYTLDLNWNDRAGAWYLSILDSAGAPLLLSRKLATHAPILKKYKSIAGLPPGELLAVDPSKSIAYAGYDELGPGRGVSLLYYDADELAGL